VNFLIEIVSMVKKQLFQSLLPFVALGFLLMHFSCDLPEDVRPEQGKTFIKLFGGDGSEVGHDLAAMPDGGFVMTGSTTSGSAAGKDLFVVRTDSLGNVIWQRNFGSDGDDVGHSILVGDDGNIYVCGEYTQDSPTGTALRDAYVVSLSMDGSSLGEHTYGDSLRDEVGTDIRGIQGAGFLITATWLQEASAYFITETDANLTPIEKRSRYLSPSGGVSNIGLSSFDRSDAAPGEPPFIAIGTAEASFTEGGNRSQVFKFQASYFNTVQDDTPPVLYGDNNSNSFCTDVEVAADGSYILCGYNVEGGATNEMVVKVRKGRFLEQLWQKVYSNEFNRNIRNPGICETNDGGFVVVSTIELNDPLNNEISVLKLNFQGEEEWRRTFGSDANDAGADVVQLDDGSYVIVGTIGFDINPSSSSKLCLIKLNANGALVPL
jgi:hypothetical protein